MSIDMDLSASRAQASSFKRMAAQKKQGYDEMERAINQFALNSPMLTGAAYDAAKRHYTNVLIPLVKAGRLYTEAAERAVQKFPEAYVSQVDSVSLKESELNDKISQLRKQIEAKKAQQSQLRQLAAHLPSEERGSARKAQQGLSNSIAALEKAKKKLEKKREKLRAFHRSSREIFSDLDSLEQAINKGANVAAHSFNGSTFVAPSKSDMDWLTDVKNYEKKLAKQELEDFKKGRSKQWVSHLGRYLYVKSPTNITPEELRMNEKYKTSLFPPKKVETEPDILTVILQAIKENIDPFTGDELTLYKKASLSLLALSLVMPSGKASGKYKAKLSPKVKLKNGKLVDPVTGQSIKNNNKLPQGSKLKNQNINLENKSWSLNKDGAIINGRKYSGHSLERMAPDTPEIRAQLSMRAHKIAKSKGFVPGTKEYSDFIKKYVQPRNVPPMIVEDTIKNGIKTNGNQSGTWKYDSKDVTVIVNDSGDVITVIPK